MAGCRYRFIELDTSGKEVRAVFQKDSSSWLIRRLPGGSGHGAAETEEGCQKLLKEAAENEAAKDQLCSYASAGSKQDILRAIQAIRRHNQNRGEHAGGS